MIHQSSLLCIFSIALLIFDTSEAISGGTPANVTQFKYFVGLKAPDRRCGGGIIHENFILTAAHCVYGLKERHLTIHAGVVDFGNDDDAIVRNVAKIHMHPEFSPSLGFLQWTLQCIKRKPNPNDYNHDIAVLKLDRPLRLTGNLEKLNLPEPESSLPYCTTAKFAGWGDIDRIETPTNQLYWMNSIIHYPALCSILEMRHLSMQFCAENPEHEAHVMQGDSGGPWVYDNVVYGVLSLGSCNVDYPAIFNNVIFQLDFIGKAMGKS